MVERHNCSMMMMAEQRAKRILDFLAKRESWIYAMKYAMKKLVNWPTVSC